MNAYNKLISHIDCLIKVFGKYNLDGYSLNWHEIDETNQYATVAFFIEYDDKDLFSLYENQKYDAIVMSLLNMLQKNHYQSNQEFTDCIKKNLVSYYAERAQELINDRCEFIESSELSKRGYYRTIAKNHGDSVIRYIGA